MKLWMLGFGFDMSERMSEDMSESMSRVQCGGPDLNRDPASSVWRAGPQVRSCEFSVACRTSTAIL